MNSPWTRRTAWLLVLVMVFSFMPFHLVAADDSYMETTETAVTEEIPTAENPVVEIAPAEPAEEEPAPVIEEPVAEEPETEPETEEPVVEDPAPEEPEAEDPATEEPSAEKVAGEETEVEEEALAVEEELIQANAVNPLLTFDLEGTVYWNDFNDVSGERPDAISLVLMRNGTKVEQEPIWTYDDANNEWHFVYKDLRFYDDNSNEYSYTLSGGQAAGYKTTIKQLTPATYTIDQVWWETPQSNLYFDQIGNPNFIVFKHGSDYVIWTMDEVQDMYKDQFIQVVNDSHNQGSMKIKPNDTVHWFFGDMQQSSRGIRVYYTEDGGWQIHFDNPNNISQFLLGRYTVTDGEAVVIQDRYMKLTVRKFWDDDDNRDGLRPDSVTVELYANGVATGKTTVLNKDNNWTHTWEKLDQFDENREPILYEAREVVPNGYEATHNHYRDDHMNFHSDITNKYTPKMRDFTVHKAWEDDNNRDGMRPESITVQLFANGTAYGEPVELNAENGWTYTWTDLYVNNEGEAIAYTVGELDLPDGYTVEITYPNDNENDAVITNTYEPQRRDITVHKVWNDDDNRDGLRPENITVQLMANDAPLGEPVELNAENNWTHTWTDLYVYENGAPIVYKVVETRVPDGYQSVVEFDNEKGEATITNTHQVHMRDFTVEKKWHDDENRDGLRPESITVQLFANGTAYGEPVELNAENDWSYTWTDLYVNDKGEPIVYTVKEVTVPEGYVVEVTYPDDDGVHAILVNTHEVFEREFSVMKTWYDDDNRDGIRPGEIRVQLYANGIAFGEPVMLNDANNWTYVWTGLHLNENGEPIVYTVEEVMVPEGYRMFIFYDDENYDAVIENDHDPELTDITVRKDWDDKDNKFNKRPDEITVRLLANGLDTGMRATLNAKNKWQHTWMELFRYENGKEIAYSVEEMNVPDGYEVLYKVDDDDANLMIVVNKLIKIPMPPKPEPPKPKPKTENPKTGDTGVVLPLVLSGLGLAGIVLLERRRKK